MSVLALLCYFLELLASLILSHCNNTTVCSSYLIAVSWQPMPCCCGQGLHYAGTQAEGSVEIECIYWHVTEIYNTFWQNLNIIHVIFSPLVGLEVVLYNAHWGDGHGYKERFLWKRTDKDQRNSVSIPFSRTAETDREDKAWPLTCDLPLLSQVSLSAWNMTAQYTGTIESPSLSPDSHQGNGYLVFYCMHHWLRWALLAANSNPETGRWRSMCNV